MDPSLCDKQRQLKRARLADTLSNQLQLRPGPLELIQKNILHTDDSAVEQAVKEGQITFRPTNEGLPLKQVDLPDAYTINSFDDDSNSEGVLSPPSVNGGVAKSESSESVLTAVTASPSQVPAGAPKQTLKPVVSQADVLAQQVPVAAVVPTTVQAVAAATTAAKQKAAAIIASSAKGERGPSDVGAAGGFFAVPSPPSVANCSTSSASSVNSVLASVTAINNSLQQQQQQQQRQQQQPYSRRGAPGKDQTSRKKKVKPKPSGAAQKSRTIKFHEYKVGVKIERKIYRFGLFSSLLN